MYQLLRQQAAHSCYQRDHRLIFLLISNFWFRLAVLGCLLIGISAPLSNLKLFESTPPHVSPPIKISLLDHLQARSLARTARGAMAAREGQAALHAWRSAIGNHPGNAGYNQAFLETLIQFDHQKTEWNHGLQTCLWLLNLSQTNRTDLELTCQVLEHYQLHSETLQLIDHYPQAQTTLMEQHYLKALFKSGDEQKFHEHWLVSTDQTRNEPELNFYRQAYEAARATGVQRASIAASLKETAPELDQEIRHRGMLYVYDKINDIKNYEAILEEMTEEFSVTIGDQLQYWMLLARNNQVERAQEMAQSLIIAPKTGQEVLKVADAYSRLGLSDLAFRYLRNYTTALGFSEQRRWAEIQLLLRDKRWSDLHAFALNLRQLPNVPEADLGLSHYLEGVVNLKTKRTSDAEAAFHQIRRYRMDSSHVGLYVGANLWELGYAEEAYSALSPQRERYANNLSFWDLLFDVTTHLQLPRQMLVAAENRYRLDRTSIIYKTDYSSLLISLHSQPEHALALTLEATLEQPDNPLLQINHAQALILNHRIQEAMALLRKIDPTTLNAGIYQGYAFAWLSVCHLTEKRDLARKLIPDIIPALLLPGDRRYFRAIENWADKQNPSQPAPGDID